MKYKLSEICSGITDGSHNPPLGVNKSNFLMLSSKNIYDDLITYDEPRYLTETEFAAEDKRTSIKSGDILMTIVGTVGRTAVVDEQTPLITLQRSVAVLHPKKDRCNSRYLMYLLRSKRQFFEAESHGVAQKGIYLKQLSEVCVNIPDILEQVEIVGILDKIQNIIRIRQRELNQLDNLIKARFVEMFGDVIQNNMGWSKHVFSEIASSRLGKMLDAKQQKGNCKFPYLANFNVQWFRFELKNLNEMDFDKEDQVEFELKDGDLLVCEGGEIGRCAVWHNELQPCYFQKALHRVRCNTNIILPDYMARWFQYNCEHGGFSSIEGAKATISHLPGAKLKTLQVVTPPIDIQKIFVDFVAQVDKTKEVVKKSLDKAQLLFDSLMQRYFG